MDFSFQDLLRVEEPVGQEAWNKFLFNVPAAIALGSLSAEDATLLCQAGHKWQGTGWTTARASKLLHTVSGVPLVAAQISHYRDAWLFALALWFEVEVTYLDLSDRSSEAAFAICSALATAGSAAERDAPRHAQPEDEDEEPVNRLPWDEQQQALPGELAIIWQGVKAGSRRLDLKSILERLPKFEGLPHRAPDNNHRGDSKRGIDQSVKGWSQKVLHSLRLQAHIYHLMLAAVNPAMVKILFEQHFQLMGELYQTLCNHRKELSIPGSVVVQNDVLFDKDSLQLAQQQQKVNRASFGSGTYKSFPLFSQKIITTPTASKGKSFGNRSQRFGYRSSAPYQSPNSGKGNGYLTEALSNYSSSSLSGFQFQSTDYRSYGKGQGGQKGSYGRGQGGYRGRGLFSLQGFSFSSSSSQADCQDQLVATMGHTKCHSFVEVGSSSPLGRRQGARPPEGCKADASAARATGSGPSQGVHANWSCFRIAPPIVQFWITSHT